MRRRVCLLVIACVALSCKADKPQGDQTPKGSIEPDRPPTSRAELAAMVSEALDALVAQETKADVTCWTSFRQLDWYIAEKTYAEFATLAKVTAIKGLTRALWVKASSATSGPLTASDIKTAVALLGELAVPELKRAELTGFANDIGLRNYTDYQKTAEHWRIVVAVVEDEIFNGLGDDRVKVASGDALTALADAATTLSLHLLKRSSARATEAKSTEIEGSHVKDAFAELATELAIANQSRKVAPLSYRESIEILAPLTKRLIEGKGQALLTFNRASGDLAADLSRVSEIPVSKEAANVFYAAALSFAHFATSGADPMRADNYLSDGSFEKTEIENAPYINHLQIHNVVEQVFPHRVLANGDVMVRFEPNPGPQTVGKIKLDPFEIRMLDHRMNGVRDSAIHWKALADVFTRRPYAIDPFAAEYLSEVVSMIVTLNIERAVRLAKERRAETISGELATEVLKSKAFTQVPIRVDERPAWDKKWAAKKALVLASVPKALFANVTAGSGLPSATKEVAGASDSFDIQTIMGGGVAVGDVNRDGFPDLYLGGDGLGRLLVNRGLAGPGKFEDATTAWGLPEISDSHGVLFFDIEGDGDLDLVVLRSSAASALFRNDGNSFVDVTRELGFKTGRGAHVAHAFDYDSDGDLDLYVGYYGARSAHRDPKVQSLPALDGRNGSPNQLWRNDGDKLAEVAAAANVADVGWTLAVGSFDYELDGDLDLYLANDFGANAFYRNDGGGKFTDISALTGTGDRGSGMNVDVTDANGDGFWDVYVTNIDMFSKRIKVIFPRDESTIDLDRALAESFQYLSGNKFYVSKGARGFEAVEQRLFEPGDRGWGWDAHFFDYENDGDEDLYLANGWIDGSYAGNQVNQMFLYDQVFHLVTPSSPEAFAGNTRSVAAADFDRDGDIDLILNQYRKPPVMLENRQASAWRWVRIALHGAGKNPAAIGARVKVSSGARSFLRQVSAGRGYLSQAEAELLIGVGDAATVDVEVTWPGGVKSTHTGLATNDRHELRPN